MEQLRRVLVERYVGLVMVCAFVYQAMVCAFAVLKYRVYEWLILIYIRPAGRHAGHDLPTVENIWSPTGQLTLLLNELLVAILLYRWLYPERSKSAAPLDSQGHED